MMFILRVWEAGFDGVLKEGQGQNKRTITVKIPFNKLA